MTTILCRAADRAQAFCALYMDFQQFARNVYVQIPQTQRSTD
jgi:hypothetical protein